MKKLTILLFVLIPLFCNAQNKWFIYLQGGPNLSFIYTKDINNPQTKEPAIWGNGSEYAIPYYPCNKLKFGGTCGIGVKYEMHENWALNMSINFSQKGGRGHFDKYILTNDYYGLHPDARWCDAYQRSNPIAIYDIDANIYYTYQYLTIPLHCQWQFKGFFIHAGMFLAVPLNCFTYSSFYLDSKICSHHINFSYLKYKIDFGIICGLGYKFTITEKNFIVAEITSNTSLPKGSYPWGKYPHKNQCFDLLLKYERRLK